MVDVEQCQSTLPWTYKTVVVQVRVGAVSEDFALIREYDRSQVGDARANGEDSSLYLGVERDLGRNIRSRSDQAHFTLGHVPQLRKLIELETPQRSAHGSYTGVGCSG